MSRYSGFLCSHSIRNLLMHHARYNTPPSGICICANPSGPTIRADGASVPSHKAPSVQSASKPQGVPQPCVLNANLLLLREYMAETPQHAASWNFERSEAHLSVDASSPSKSQSGSYMRFIFERYPIVKIVPRRFFLYTPVAPLSLRLTGSECQLWKRC